MKQQRTAWRWMVALTAVALAALSIIKTVYGQVPVAVTAWQVTRQTVTQTVVCTGTLQMGKGTAVVTGVPCVIGTVEATAGDRVKKGDVLMTVDRAATLAQASQLGLSQTAHMTASAALPDCVTAPEDGVVAEVAVETGDWSDGTTPCMTLSGDGGIQVAITVSEQNLSKVQVGQTVRVSGVAFEKDVYDARLTHLASSAHRTASTNGSRTVVDGVVSLEPSQIDRSLMAGLTAKAVITVDTRENAVVIPYEAVLEQTATTAVVYCIDGHQAYRRTVNVLEETADGLEIQGGLSPGEWVVVNPEGIEGEATAITVEAVACRS